MLLLSEPLVRVGLREPALSWLLRNLICFPNFSDCLYKSSKSSLFISIAPFSIFMSCWRPAVLFGVRNA